MMMHEAEVGHLGVTNLYYEDDTALCTNNHCETDELINQVNDAWS